MSGRHDSRKPVRAFRQLDLWIPGDPALAHQSTKRADRGGHDESAQTSRASKHHLAVPDPGDTRTWAIHQTAHP